MPSANMLCCSLRHGEDQLLDASRDFEAYAHHGKTMGIPLLYPWANRLAALEYEVAGKRVSLDRSQALLPSDPNGLPIHGVLPGRLGWQVQAGSDPDRIVARLRWKDPELLEVFPFAHEACFEAQVREGELEISLTVRPTGSDQLPVSFGFHPYLRLPGTPRQRNRVKLSAFRRLVLDERSIPTGERVPLDRRTFRLGDRSLDDGLDGLALPSEFVVSAGGVTITMTFEYGFPFAQVYAPPGSDFICFEPMTAATNALRSGDGLLVLEPGEEHRSAFSIRIARRGA